MVLKQNIQKVWDTMKITNLKIIGIEGEESQHKYRRLLPDQYLIAQVLRTIMNKCDLMKLKSFSNPHLKLCGEPGTRSCTAKTQGRTK